MKSPARYADSAVYDEEIYEEYEYDDDAADGRYEDDRPYESDYDGSGYPPWDDEE